MLPPSPRKRTCRVRDDSGFHQEEEDPVFQLPLFPMFSRGNLVFQILFPLGVSTSHLEGSSHSHCLPLLKHVGIQIPGFPDSEGGLHLPFALLDFTGGSGEVLSTFQCRDSQTSHQHHGWNHPPAQGLHPQVSGTLHHGARDGVFKISFLFC